MTGVKASDPININMNEARKFIVGQNIKDSNSIFTSYAKDFLQFKQANIHIKSPVNNSTKNKSKLKDQKAIYTKKVNAVTLIDKITK